MILVILFRIILIAIFRKKLSHHYTHGNNASNTHDYSPHRGRRLYNEMCLHYNAYNHLYNYSAK